MNTHVLLAVAAILGVALSPFALLVVAILVEDWWIRRRAAHFRREVKMIDLEGGWPD